MGRVLLVVPPEGGEPVMAQVTGYSLVDEWCDEPSYETVPDIGGPLARYVDGECFRWATPEETEEYMRTTFTPPLGVMLNRALNRTYEDALRYLVLWGDLRVGATTLTVCCGRLKCDGTFLSCAIHRPIGREGDDWAASCATVLRQELAEEDRQPWPEDCTVPDARSRLWGDDD